MMHTSNDEGLDSEHPENRTVETSNNDVLDLGLPLVEVVSTGLGEPPGAGVNATETTTTLIDNNDPLCELVWSAHSGLSLTKCADSGCPDQRRPFLLWNVWPEINKPPEKLIPSPEIPDVISESGEKGAISMSSRDVRSRQESDEEVTSACGKSTKNKVVEPIPTPIPIPIPVVNSGGAENSDHAISHRDCLRLEKGKEKALLLSSESTESSCNRGVKRRVNDEEEEEAGSQRRKMRIPESRVFSRTVSPSFANWISTLVKGNRDDVARARKSGTDSPDSGFRAVFKTLYNPKKSEESRVLTAFAKISNALKNVTRQLENAESSSLDECCCFCGEGGHDLRKCPRLTSAELRGLLGKLDSFEEGGPPCLCLKCFRLGHWAVSCPTSGDADVARAVRKLWLSRDDVLRMVKSDDVSLDGFFLRLRLRDSGYYVARITGCDSNESISVDVGGIKSSVASRYISNHDFVEGEIEAWWGGTVRAGGKVPSLDELNAKVEDRTRLGFSSRPHET